MTDAEPLDDARAQLEAARRDPLRADPERLSSLAAQAEPLDPRLAGGLRTCAQRVRALQAKQGREQSRVLKPKYRAGGLDRF